jgi:hypothetical protein
MRNFHDRDRGRPLGPPPPTTVRTGPYTAVRIGYSTRQRWHLLTQVQCAQERLDLSKGVLLSLLWRAIAQDLSVFDEPPD